MMCRLRGQMRSLTLAASSNISLIFFSSNGVRVSVRIIFSRLPLSFGIVDQRKFFFTFEIVPSGTFFQICQGKREPVFYQNSNFCLNSIYQRLGFCLGRKVTIVQILHLWSCLLLCSHPNLLFLRAYFYVILDYFYYL